MGMLGVTFRTQRRCRRGEQTVNMANACILRGGDAVSGTDLVAIRERLYRPTQLRQSLR